MLRVLVGGAALAVVIMLSLLPSSLVGQLRPDLAAWIEHALAYGALAIVLRTTIGGGGTGRTLGIFLALTALAALLEAGQLLVPDRSSHLSDIAGSALGAAVALLSWQAIATMKRSRRRHSDRAKRNSTLGAGRPS